MKICLYSPYFPTHFGGGEKYLLDVAQVLATKHKVSIAISTPGQVIDESNIKQAYEKFFNCDLSKIALIATPLGSTGQVWQKLPWTSKFDVMYYVTDGSLFFSVARKNILHIQIPFTNSMNSVTNRAKLANWHVKNSNSAFTRQVVEQAWKTRIDEIHYPMIEVNHKFDVATLQKHKQKIILNVGRFFRQLHSKRQDVLVRIFRELRDKHPTALKGWKLVLVGGVEDKEYADEVHALAKDLPVEFHHELSRKDLEKMYLAAPIYWHAAGFDIDQTKHPEKVEHFGITTVEAMAYAAVPVVIGKGGQPEILGPELHQYLWQSAAECLDLSYALIKDSGALKTAQTLAVARASVFNRQAFEQTLWRMIET